MIMGLVTPTQPGADYGHICCVLELSFFFFRAFHTIAFLDADSR